MVAGLGGVVDLEAVPVLVEHSGLAVELLLREREAVAIDKVMARVVGL